MQDIISSYLQLIQNQLKIAKLESKLTIISVLMLVATLGLFVVALFMCWLLFIVILGVVIFTAVNSLLVALCLLLAIHLALLISSYFALKHFRKTIGFKKTKRHLYKLMIKRIRDESYKKNATA